MRKYEEINNNNSCLNRALDDELIFVLLGRDITTPQTIRYWINERIRLGKNHPSDSQIYQASLLASEIEAIQLQKQTPELLLDDES